MLTEETVEQLRNNISKDDNFLLAVIDPEFNCQLSIQCNPLDFGIIIYHIAKRHPYLIPIIQVSLNSAEAEVENEE
jgi:hypothetical protein